MSTLDWILLAAILVGAAVALGSGVKRVAAAVIADPAAAVTK